MVKGHVTYYLSPFAQRVFHNALATTFANGFRWLRSNWQYPTIPFAGYLYLHYWADKTSKEIKLHHRD